MSKLLNVSSSPHVRSSVSTQNLMYDVAIAMLPATIWGVMQFGYFPWWWLQRRCCPVS